MKPQIIWWLKNLKNRSLIAFIALNGDLTTDASGDRFLVNSKGDDVLSTTGQMLDFDGVSEYITATKDITSMKTILLNFKDYDETANYIFDNGGAATTSFVLRAEVNKFRLYYSDDGVTTVWHDYTFIDWSSLERVGVSITSTALNLYFNGLLVASFPPPFSDVYSSGTSWLMTRDNLDSFAKAKTGNIQIWHTPFSSERMLFDSNYPELSYQLAFAEEENLYLEEVNIPTYDSGDATHLLITTLNGAWTQANFDVATPYRHFYMEAGDYGLTRINLEAIGTSNGEYTLSLYNGNDTHPASLLDAEQANCFFHIQGGEYWTIDRLSFLDKDVGTLPAIRVINESNHNTVNRWHCRGFKYGYQVYNRVGSWGMSNYNTIQNSYIHDQVDVIAGTAYDGVAMDLYAYDVDIIDTIGNKFVNNDICNSGDAFQSTRTANNGDNTKNGEGTIVYNNRAWLTSNVYRDSDGTLNPLGEYSQTEEAIDLKFGSENPLNPMIIEKNMAFGFRAPLKDGASANSPIPFFTHFGVRNFKMNYNVSVENGGLISLISAEDYEAIGNISADTNLTNPNDLSFKNAIHLSNATRGDVNENVVRNHATSTSGSGDAIGTAGSLLNSLDSNVVISSKDLVIGATDTITNTWLYNHTGADAGETDHVYATEAEAEMSDFAFEYERYTTTPKIKIVKGVLTDTLSPHFGLAGSDLEVDKSIGKLVMLPLIEGVGVPKEYVSNSVVDTSSFIDINASWNLADGLSKGLQKIYFNDDMTKSNTMTIDSDTQVITTVPTEDYSIKAIGSNGVIYIYTVVGTTATLWTGEVASASTLFVTNIEYNVASIKMGFGEITDFKVYLGNLKSGELPSTITDFNATDNEVGQITSTFSNATGNPTPTYNLIDTAGAETVLATDISSGYIFLVGESTFNLRVDAVSTLGTTPSNVDSGTSIAQPPLSAPSAIVDFNATDTEVGQATNTWSDATGNPTPTYDLYRDWNLLEANVTSPYVDTTGVVGQTYTYKVHAVNSQGFTASNDDTGTSV